MLTQTSASDSGPLAYRPKKKIALFIDLLVDRSGGAERVFVELANMLVERGYEVACLHYEQRAGRPFYGLDPRIELINLWLQRLPRAYRSLNALASKGLVPEGPRNRLEWYIENQPVISQLRDYFLYTKPAVAISFLPPANTPALLASAGTPVKVIPTHHNVPAEDYDNPARWSRNPYDRKLRREALQHAAAIHVALAGFAEWFPEDLRSKIVAIPNYVSSEILQARPVSERDKVVLAVGGLRPAKNYGALVEAWKLIAARHPDWKVVIYGAGPLKLALASNVLAAGLDASFELAGQRTNLGEAYAKAAIFCHPALCKSFDLAPLEALALGMPVVAYSDCIGINRFVVDGKNALLADRGNEPASLAAALEQLILDPELRQKLGGNGPAGVAGLTEEKFANAWVELIERVTAPEVSIAVR